MGGGEEPKREGKTVFLTTHYMEEAEVLADSVAIITRGKIIASGEPHELVDSHFKSARVTLRHAGQGVEKAVGQLGLNVSKLENGDYAVDVPDINQIYEVLKVLKDNGVKYGELDVRKPNLEAVFLALTGETLSAGGEEK